MAETPAPKNTISYRYIFRFANGTEKRFEVHLDPTTLELIPAARTPRPEWTKLKYYQCEKCPLGDAVTYCPIAVNLSNLVESFKDAISYEGTAVTVETSQRTYTKQTSIQGGLSSIIGISMVTSGCPVMDKLRPNVRFHLPFASTDETSYRAIAMYLVAQYFRMRRGDTPDWELKHLGKIYKEVWLVNKGMSQRLSHASSQDANVNAVITLSSFGATLDDHLEESLQTIETLFENVFQPEGE